jgi:hypothetical protein
MPIEFLMIYFVVYNNSSAECQIGHWRSWHKYECIEMETEEGHAKDETPMLVEEKYDNVRFLSFAHKDFASLIHVNAF